MSVEVRPVRDDDELAAVMALREAVFVREQEVPAELEVDGLDARATHLVALTRDQVVGTARLLVEDGDVKLGRLAVARDVRRRGIARRLLAAGEAWAREQGARRIVLGAQTYARELYAAAGYTARGETYIDAGIEHVRMERPLA